MKTYLSELKRRGVLADAVNVDEEAEAAEDDVQRGMIGREHDHDEDHAPGVGSGRVN